MGHETKRIFLFFHFTLFIGISRFLPYVTLVHAHRPQAGFLAPVYMPMGHRPVFFRARSAHVQAHLPQAGFLSGAKRPCTCSPAAGRWPEDAPQVCSPPSAGASREMSVANEAASRCDKSRRIAMVLLHSKVKDIGWYCVYQPPPPFFKQLS